METGKNKQWCIVAGIFVVGITVLTVSVVMDSRKSDMEDGLYRIYEEAEKPATDVRMETQDVVESVADLSQEESEIWFEGKNGRYSKAYIQRYADKIMASDKENKEELLVSYYDRVAEGGQPMFILDELLMATEEEIQAMEATEAQRKKVKLDSKDVNFSCSVGQLACEDVVKCKQLQLIAASDGVFGTAIANAVSAACDEFSVNKDEVESWQEGVDFEILIDTEYTYDTYRSGDYIIVVMFDETEFETDTYMFDLFVYTVEEMLMIDMNR